VRAGPYDGIDGLAWGYRFSETGVAELVQGSALREAMEKQEVWLWLNFDLADERASATIAGLPHLPPGALAMLRSADDSQQIDGFGQVIAGVVADYELCDPPDERRVVRWNFAMTPYLFISAQRRPSHALNQVRSDLQSGRRLPDVLGLFHALVHELASAISFVLNELGAKLNEMEERLLDQKEVGLLPPTFITGIFGMNVSGLPFQETAYGFWVACGLLAASMAGMLVVLRRFRLI
jgi:Mg2+ and Co2+ transporter CorA